MKTFFYTTNKSAAGLVAACLFINAAFATLPTDDHLTAGEILNLSAQHYAALSTYSDQGQVVTTIDGMVSTTTFITHLARPGCFLVEWQRTRRTSTTSTTSNTRAVFSLGAGDFLETGQGPQDEFNPDIALEMASPFSGGASVTIPMTFFQMSAGDELDGTGFGENRLPDEKVGKIDCFVLTSKRQDRTKTLWIGRKDFLIHQVQTVVGAQTIWDDMAHVTNESSESSTLLQQWTSTETITNIVVNQTLSRSDFSPNIPHFADSYSE